MEYDLKKNSISTAYTLLDTVSEQPVDVDLTLPDYCPDIERILRCSVQPMIYKSNISGDRLSVEGGACVRVLYIGSDNKCLSSFEYTVPFSESFQLKDSPDESAVYVDTKPEYINCRALSPRKLSLHGAFSLYARVVVKKPLEYNTHEAGDSLEAHYVGESASELCGVCHDVFSVQEDISMSGYPDAAVLLSHRMCVKVTELKPIHRKLMLTAEAKLELTYLSQRDSNDVQSMTYAFPISRIIDCEGADEDSVVDYKLDVMCYELKLNSDALDGSGVLGVDMKLCLNALCCRERDVSVIDDVFSTEREIQSSFEPLSFRGGTRVLCFTDSSKAEVSVEGESISSVISVFAERISVSAAISGGAPLLSAKLNVGIMYVNGDGDTRCIDRDIEFDYNPSCDGFDSIDSVTANVDSLSWRIINDNTLELRAEVDYRMTVSRGVSLRALGSVSSDDDAPELRREGSLILYYADKGETVWNIAKRFFSRPEDILSENAIEGDVLSDDMMLLIPTA